MPGDDLRSKLNAKADAERKERALAAEAARKYHEAVLREYPRLANELLSRVKALVDGAKDLSINTQMVKETLKKTYGSTDQGFQEAILGVVEVPHFLISIAGQPRIEFKPGGTNRLLLHGAIDVNSSRPTSLAKGAIIMVNAKGDDYSKWALAVIDPQSMRPTELTDAKLAELLEQALL
jgi:hypothetical protein